MNKKNVYFKTLILGCIASLISCTSIIISQEPDSTGLGDSAAQMLEGYSPDMFMDELMNSPLLTDKDREEIANLSPDEQAELFDSLMGFFNDPEIQKVLNDPKFLEDIAKINNEIMNAPDIDWDALNLQDDEIPEIPQPEKSSIPFEEPAPTEPAKPSKEACENIQVVLSKILGHINSLERKSTRYEFIEQYWTAFKNRIDEFRFFLDVLQKPRNLELLASEEFNDLHKELCNLLSQLSRFEPEIPLREPQTDEVYNPYEILGVSPKSTKKEIEYRFEKLAYDKSPEHIKERLIAAGTEERKITKKVKEAELIFQPIKKAYEDLMDDEYREEIDRILEAERRKQEGVEGFTQLAIENTIMALDETFFTPGIIISRIKELLAKYDVAAFEELQKRLEEERKEAERIEEYAKKHPQPSPLPAPSNDYYYDFPYLNDYYRPGDYYDRTPGRPVYPPAPTDTGKKDQTKKPDEKKPKPPAKPNGKKDDKKGPGKPPATPPGTIDPKALRDTASMALKDLDSLLTKVERGEEDLFMPGDDKPKAEPKKEAPEEPKEDKEKKPQDNKKEAPKKSEKASKQDLDKLINEFADVIGSTKQSTGLRAPHTNAQDLDKKIKKLTQRLRLPELDLKAQYAALEIQRFYEQQEKSTKLPPKQQAQIVAKYKESHKKLLGGINKDHIVLFEKLKELAELTGSKEEGISEATKKLYFRTIETTPEGDVKVTKPTNSAFIELQDQAISFLTKMNEVRNAIENKKKEEEKKKAEKAQQAK